MMKTILAIMTAAAIVFASSSAIAQVPAAKAASSDLFHLSDGGPVTIMQAPVQASGGVINIGQAFGTVLQPYIDALLQAAIVGGIGWLGWFFKTKLNINIDQGQRDALNTFLTNAASSLIAAGAVQIKDKTVHVRSEALAAEANSAITRIPDALAHFGLDAPSAARLLEDKIMDAIPQVAAGAAMLAQAHAADPAAPIADAPMASAERPAAPMPAPAPEIPAEAPKSA